MEIETVSHLFCECDHVQQFCTSVSDFLRLCDSNINIKGKTIPFGICHAKPKCDDIVINFIKIYFQRPCKTSTVSNGIARTLQYVYTSTT